MIFETILKGSYIGVTALIFRFIIKLLKPEWIEIVYKAFPFKQKFTITSMSTILIALFFSIFLNFFLNEKKFVIKAIHKFGNELELLLEKAIQNKSLLLITLKNDKVYVGWGNKLPIPGISQKIRILPAISGYRDTSKKIIFTTHYLSIYSEFIKEGAIKDIRELETEIIIDINQIISISLFNIELYNKFNVKETL